MCEIICYRILQTSLLGYDTNRAGYFPYLPFKPMPSKRDLQKGLCLKNFIYFLFFYYVKKKKNQKRKILGSGGIRTHASEETGALNQRLRPLGHATEMDNFRRKLTN